jgi:hypothetical protein
MMHLVSLGWDKTVISYVEVALEHLGGVEFDSKLIVKTYCLSKLLHVIG